MRYTTLAHQHKYLFDALTNLETQVRKYIDDGWKPQGGVSIIKNIDNDAYYVVQVMVRE